MIRISFLVFLILTLPAWRITTNSSFIDVDFFFLFNLARGLISSLSLFGCDCISTVIPTHKREREGAKRDHE